MSELASTLLGMLRGISERPILVESTPEAVHGMFEGLAVVLVYELTGRDFGKSSAEVNFTMAWREVLRMIKEVTLDVCKSEAILVMLCDEAIFPKRVSSFDAFREHSARFLQLLEARYGIAEETPAASAAVSPSGQIDGPKKGSDTNRKPSRKQVPNESRPKEARKTGQRRGLQQENDKK